MKGDMALISQGGQRRGQFKLGVKYVLVDFKSGNATDLDLKADLAVRGRDSGEIHLADTDGTLVFVTLSLEEARNSRAYRNRSLVPEIWARTSKGDYVKVAASAHYQVTRNGEVIYWEPSTREFMAFSLPRRTTRRAPEFKVAEHKDVRTGVIRSSDRRDLEYGVKVNDQWKYEPLGLEIGQLK
jgi:hypothetical protein